MASYSNPLFGSRSGTAVGGQFGSIAQALAGAIANRNSASSRNDTVSPYEAELNRLKLEEARKSIGIKDIESQAAQQKIDAINNLRSQNGLIGNLIAGGADAKYAEAIARQNALNSRDENEIALMNSVYGKYLGKDDSIGLAGQAKLRQNEQESEIAKLIKESELKQRQSIAERQFDLPLEREKLRVELLGKAFKDNPDLINRVDFNGNLTVAQPQEQGQLSQAISGKPMGMRAGIDPEIYATYNEMGVPLSETDPSLIINDPKKRDEYKKKRLELDQKALGEINKQSTQDQETLTKLEELDYLNKEADTGSWRNVAADFVWEGLGNAIMSDEAEKFNARSKEIQTAQHKPGMGAASDADMRMYQTAVPNITKSPRANAAIIKAGRALTQVSIEKREFLNTAVQAGKSLSEAQKDWSEYANSTHGRVFNEGDYDEDGVPNMNPNRMHWRDYFKQLNIKKHGSKVGDTQQSTISQAMTGQATQPSQPSQSTKQEVKVDKLPANAQKSPKDGKWYVPDGKGGYLLYMED